VRSCGGGGGGGWWVGVGRNDGETPTRIQLRCLIGRPLKATLAHYKIVTSGRARTSRVHRYGK